MTNTVRLISRLDIKGPDLIKGIQFEGLRKMGIPQDFATKYYEQGVDEILFVDSVASLYQRSNMTEILEEAVKNIYVPLTVAGGVRSIDDARKLLRSGADKIAINTQAIETPTLISDLANEFGSQCVVLSIEAKNSGDGTWEAYTKGGRERSGVDAVAWAEEGQNLGAGEILITSVDQDGTRRGFDIPLVSAIMDKVSLPVIACGGFGALDHVDKLLTKTEVNAVAMATCLHYDKLTLKGIRQRVASLGFPVRNINGD